jgi:hypothetical protein
MIGNRLLLMDPVTISPRRERQRRQCPAIDPSHLCDNEQSGAYFRLSSYGNATLSPISVAAIEMDKLLVVAAPSSPSCSGLSNRRCVRCHTDLTNILEGEGQHLSGSINIAMRSFQPVNES